MLQWLSDLREKVTLHDGTPVPVVLLANKCDIQGIDIATETMAKFCNDNGIAAWFVTSAKENVNIGKQLLVLIINTSYIIFLTLNLYLT